MQWQVGPRLAWLLLAALLFLAPRARALAPSALAVSASGQCPAGERVRRQLVPLLPDTSVFLGESGTTETVWVADGGDEFLVKVRHVQRVIQDAARDCEERARIAAVFVALVVDPPLPAADDSGKNELSPSPAPVSEPGSSPEPPSPVARPAWGATQAGVVAALAPGREGARPWGMGPVLRLSADKPWWEVSVAAAFLSPARLQLGEAGVKLTRVPLHLSGSFVFGGSHTRGFFGAGPAGDLLHLTGTRVSRAHSSVRFNAGVRGHAGLRILLGSGIWGAAETSVSYFPRPYEFEVPPRGVVGQTPSLWLDATLGALFEIR